MSIKKEKVFSGNFTELITGFQIIQAKIKSFDELGLVIVSGGFKRDDDHGLQVRHQVKGS